MREGNVFTFVCLFTEGGYILSWSCPVGREQGRGTLTRGLAQGGGGATLTRLPYPVPSKLGPVLVVLRGRGYMLSKSVFDTVLPRGAERRGGAGWGYPAQMSGLGGGQGVTGYPNQVTLIHFPPPPPARSGLGRGGVGAEGGGLVLV